MAEENDEITVEWKNKTEKMKRVQFFRELEQIKLQRLTLERERTGFMYQKRDKRYSDLEDAEKLLNNELRNERLKIEQQLKQIRKKVNDFQKELKDVKPTPAFVEQLKVLMETIESTIGEFKHKQREIFENLMMAEKETDQEIETLEGKIKLLLEGGGVTAQRVRSARPTMKSQNKHLPKEIQEFENFVSHTGGMQGGWDDYDHGTFLRIREKFHANKAFIQAAVRQIPGRTEDDIAEHEKWYSCFLDLKKRKKDAIMAWRREKEEKENEKNGPVDMDPDEARMKKEKEDALVKRLMEEREAKKEEVQKWKTWEVHPPQTQKETKPFINSIEMNNMQKQEKAEMEAQRRNEEERQKKLLEEKKKSERNVAREVARQILKERREDEERLHWMKEIEAEQMEIERQQEVKERIARFQSRDRIALKLKQNEQKRKDEIEQAKKERLEKTKMKVVANRDPTRLYQLTEGWVHRTKGDADASDSRSSLPAKMPHRAVPTWRQNL